jgi:hypothetical protein
MKKYRCSLEATVTANSQIKPSQFLALKEDKEQLEDWFIVVVLNNAPKERYKPSRIGCCY